MRALLMHRDDDFDVEAASPANADDLLQDLGLKALFDAMANGDDFLFHVAKSAVLRSLADPAPIEYRQAILMDCLDHPDVVRRMYAIAVAGINDERQAYGGILATRRPSSILSRSVSVVELFVNRLRQLRDIAAAHVDDFRSDGFNQFFSMLEKELHDGYLAEIEQHLRTLRFRSGVLISARLGAGNKGVDYVLREPGQNRESLVQRLTPRNRAAYTVTVPDRDEAGATALSELRDRGVSLVANALAQSADHVLGFFRLLRAELGFYLGCLNLHRRLTEAGRRICFPEAAAAQPPRLRAKQLYDAALALQLGDAVVGNDFDADGRTLIMITGANQGGKSTFLRSVGLAQLMMQSGMFVAAESYAASTASGVFTHYTREEDETMTSGKLDEELSRMSGLVDDITPNALLLCNESFAATNEREGSEIARQVTNALLDSGVRVAFVTHLFDLAQSLYHRRADTALFLRADRQADGRRTFRLAEGAPLPTSFGGDLYRDIFGTAPNDQPCR